MREPRTRRRAAGFTMIELMVVVAIIGITAALTIRGFTRSSVGGDARKVAAMMATAYRTAMSGGPIRTDVAAANPTLRWRAVLEFSEASGQNLVAVYQIVEHSGDTGFDQVLVSNEVLSPDTIIFSVASTAAIDPGTSTVTASNLSTSTLFDQYYCADGTTGVLVGGAFSVNPITAFLKHRTNDAATHYRVLGMGLNPVPQVFQEW
jgi:prepilin-type N-terminal cleavage/methylation domain-containing protein